MNKYGKFMNAKFIAKHTVTIEINCKVIEERKRRNKETSIFRFQRIQLQMNDWIYKRRRRTSKINKVRVELHYTFTVHYDRIVHILMHLCV